jgi:hypothetical protein
MKFQQNEKLGNQLLKYYKHRYIFNNPEQFWGANNNVFGYVLTHTCYDLCYLKWKEPGDNKCYEIRLSIAASAPYHRTVIEICKKAF